MLDSKDGKRQSTAKSPAIALELKLKEAFEQYPTSPCKDRAAICFKVLDELSSLTGPFQPVIKSIYEELYRSVYSKDVTSSTKEPFVERIPYFQTLTRIDEQNSTETNKLKDEIAEYQKKLKFKEQELTVLYKKNLALKAQVSEHDQVVAQFETSEKELVDKVRTLTEEKEKAVGSAHDELEYLKHKVETLTSSLANANALVQKLSVFETGYDQAGDRHHQDNEEDDESKEDFLIDPEGLVQYDLIVSKQIDTQFSEIFNLITEDYEVSLSQLKKKRELLNDALGNENGQRDEAYKIELNDLINTYRRRVTDLLEEQKSLQKHTKGLQISYQRNQIDRTKLTLKRTADMALRKYAICASISDDGGETFKPLRNMVYCQKCAEKTLVCPHRTFSPLTFTVQANTQLKFFQPKLRLRTTRKDVPADASESKKKAYKLAQIQDPLLEGMETEDDIFRDLDEIPDYLNRDVSLTIRSIWRDYYRNREGKQATATRLWGLDKALSLIHDVYDYRFKYEQALIEQEDDDDMCKFVDTFYEFLTNRYQVKEVALRIAHEFFRSIFDLASEIGKVGLFLRTLSGEDDCSWKYLYLAHQLWKRYSPMDPTKYKQMVNVLYPSRTRETLEQIELEHIAFTKSKYTIDALEEHMLHMLRHGIEPNYKLFQKALRKATTSQTNSLTYEEFDSVFGPIMPQVGAKFKHNRFRHIQSLCRGLKAVPVSRLAMLATYCGLQACADAGWVPQTVIFDAGFDGTVNEEHATTAPAQPRLHPKGENTANPSQDESAPRTESTKSQPQTAGETSVDAAEAKRQTELRNQQEFEQFLAEEKARLAEQKANEGSIGEQRISDRVEHAVARKLETPRNGESREVAEKEQFKLELNDLPSVKYCLIQPPSQLCANK